MAVLIILGIVCFVSGNVLTFLVVKTVKFTNTTNEYYCNKLAYQFSFWMIISIYVILVVFGIIGIVSICVARFRN